MNSDYIECFRKAAAVLLIVATVAAVLCLTGCRAQKPLTNTIETVRIEREVIRDTTIVTKADSASIQALFACDSTNQVVLRQLETLMFHKPVRFHQCKNAMLFCLLLPSLLQEWLSKHHSHSTEQILHLFFPESTSAHSPFSNRAYISLVFPKDYPFVTTH